MRFVWFSYYKIANCTTPCNTVHYYLWCGAIMPFFRQFWCNFCGLRNLANNFRYCCHFICFAQNNLRVKFATKTIKETIKNRNNFFEGKQWRRGGIRIWASKYVKKKGCQYYSIFTRIPNHYLSLILSTQQPYIFW